VLDGGRHPLTIRAPVSEPPISLGSSLEPGQPRQGCAGRWTLGPKASVQSPGTTVDSLTEPVALRQTDQPVLAVSRRIRAPVSGIGPPTGIMAPPGPTAAVGPLYANVRLGLDDPDALPAPGAGIPLHRDAEVGRIPAVARLELSNGRHPPHPDGRCAQGIRWKHQGPPQLMAGRHIIGQSASYTSPAASAEAVRMQLHAPACGIASAAVLFVDPTQLRAGRPVMALT
jgi:hypothetical protein